MTLADPLVSTTLAHLPEASVNLAAVGVAKSAAVFFESPVIMLLHASTALARGKSARDQLWRFTLLAILFLSGLMAILCLPPVFSVAARAVFAIEGVLKHRVHWILLFLVLWPAASGWRRYFQGIMIYSHQEREVAYAACGRLAILAGGLGAGYWLRLPGYLIAGATLSAGIISEAAFVTYAARRARPPASGISRSENGLPSTLREVWLFYRPLANSKIVLWGSRMILLCIIARAGGALSLASWSTGLGIVLLFANATRMVQQVIISNRENADAKQLFVFAASVGLSSTAALSALGATPPGRILVLSFLGHDARLASAALSVIALCALVPLQFALQNALEGLMISAGKTRIVNISTCAGSAVLLLGAILGVRWGLAGHVAASLALTAGVGMELIFLAVALNAQGAPR